MYSYNAKRTFVGLMLSLFEKLAYMLIIISILAFVAAIFSTAFLRPSDISYFELALPVIISMIMMVASTLLMNCVLAIIIGRARKRDPSLFDNDMKGMVLREGQNGEGSYESADWLSNNRLRQIIAFGKQ